MSEQEPVSEGGFRYSDRSQVLCRTCMSPIWWETGEVDHRERTGWSDRIKRGGDSLVCFKAIDYRHVPLTDREWAYYEAGERTGEAAVLAARHLLQKVADYWDGRPLRMHGEHIYADLIDVLDAMTPATTEPQQGQQRSERMSEQEDLQAEYDAANAALWQAEADYEGAMQSRDPETMRDAREPFREAQNRYHRALGALVDSRRPAGDPRPTFAQLLNDPGQQLDRSSEVLAAVYTTITTDTACACTDPKCPRHYRGASG